MSDTNTGWPELMKWLLDEKLKPLNSQLEVMMGKLDDAKQALTANQGKIDEIRGDMSEVKGKVDTLTATNEELLMKIQELQAQAENNPLVDDILALATTQGEALTEIAAVIPEDVVAPPVEPGEVEPTPPTTEG